MEERYLADLLTMCSIVSISRCSEFWLDVADSECPVFSYYVGEPNMVVVRNVEGKSMYTIHIDKETGLASVQCTEPEHYDLDIVLFVVNELYNKCEAIREHLKKNAVRAIEMFDVLKASRVIVTDEQ